MPSFLFAGILIQRNHASQEDTVEILITATTRSLIQAVDRELNANITTLKVLASTPALDQGEYESFYNRTRLALAETDANLFVLNTDNTVLLSTLVPFGGAGGMTSDPRSAQRALETDDIVITDLVLGAVSQRWVYNILMPVELEVGGQKVVALNQRAENIGRALVINRLPDGWNSVLIDNQGKIIAATAGAGQTGDSFEPFDVMEQPFSVGWQRIQTENDAYQVAMQRSVLTGWRLVSYAPARVIDRPLFEAMLSLVAGGVVLATIVILSLYGISRSIGSSVRGLARDAKRLGRGELVHQRDYPITEIADISAALAEASQQRQSAESEVRFLMRELAHRSKNQMTVIAAMAKQTARGEDDVQNYVQNFEKRILGLARSTDLLLTHGRAGVELKELLTHQIAPFGPADTERVCLKGDPIRLNAQAAQILGMATHELSTNAVKYGAFSDINGRLEISWKSEDETLHLVWREITGHAPEIGERRGFGSIVLNNMVGGALGAAVERIIHNDGIEWRFDIPLAALHPDYGQSEQQA
ncbi:sensor histidine kinase [Devosia pacifica]|nr:sensor histidine kinase [Devosia pacifica]